MPARADGEGATDSGFAFERRQPAARPALAQRLLSGSAPSRERLRSFRVLGAARLLMGSILLGWFAINLLSGGARAGIVV